MVSFPCTKTAVEGTAAAFDDTVHQILRKDFAHRAADPKTCQNCDFRFYCRGLRSLYPSAIALSGR